MRIELRYFLACLLGISATLLTGVCLFMSHLMFSRQMPLILVAPIAAGVLGGLVVALFSPTQKVLLSTVVGAVVTLCLLGLLFPHSFIHMSANPFVWYWPVYLIPSFGGGGWLGRTMSERYGMHKSES